MQSRQQIAAQIDACHVAARLKHERMQIDELVVGQHQIVHALAVHALERVRVESTQLVVLDLERVQVDERGERARLETGQEVHAEIERAELGHASERVRAYRLDLQAVQIDRLGVRANAELVVQHVLGENQRACYLAG